MFIKVALFYFYFIFLVGTPINNCAKYQHPKHKILYFVEKSQNGIFYQLGPLKNFIFIFVLLFVLEPTVDEQLYQICCFLDEILQPTGPQATVGPYPSVCVVNDYTDTQFAGSRDYCRTQVAATAARCATDKQHTSLK